MDSYGTHDDRHKAEIDGHAAAVAAANFLYQGIANPAPAAANAGSVVPAQSFTPRVSGKLRVVGNARGNLNANNFVIFTLTIGAQTFTLTGTADTGRSVSVLLNHVFTGLVVGTPVTVAFTWDVGGAANTLQLGAAEGGLYIEELPN